jgi:tRNA threonylcarbamoyladenosine biosynthesis protein TsaB
VIVAFSTSSPQASVALISPEGSLLGSRDTHAPMRASGACMRLLQELLDETGRTLKGATLFAADLGPGSFTGVKVAVTIAKTMAFAGEVSAIGADSFDLISPTETVILPSKRGEWFVRRPGAAPVRQRELPQDAYLGYGPDIEPATFPHAAQFAALLSAMEPVEPEFLVPNYLIEPSISIPKTPYAEQRG